MPHKQGKIAKVYHNFKDKFGNPLAEQNINHKFYIGDEVFIIKGKNCPDFVKEGMSVSFTYQVWSPTGQDKTFYFVASNSEKLLIQKLEEATDFNVAELEKQLNQDKVINKDQYMFIMALCKSAIESKGIVCNKQSINSFISDLKEIYSLQF